jgi:3-phytase
MKKLILILAIAAILGSCKTREEKSTPIGMVDSTAYLLVPTVVTQPSRNDTDDPAIWFNKADPSKSLILGTDKGDLTGGIYVYDLAGKIDSARSVFNLKRPNNIDVEYGFNHNGTQTDIAVFTERGRQMLRVYALPGMQAIDGGGIPVFEGETEGDPMGIALYKDPANGEVYAIVSRKTGPDGSYLWQYRLGSNAKGEVSGTKVRAFGTFTGGREIESVVVDDELGYVYYSNEGVGVRQYYASPEKGNNELALFATTGITEDHEGLSIYKTSATTGYILLSDQEVNQFRIYSREGTKENPYEHKLLKIIKVSARESDGSDVTEMPLNDVFRHGMFVAMSTNKTFHYYRWEDIAGNELEVGK